MDLEEIRTCCESLEQDITALRIYSEMIDAVQTIAAEITAPPKSNADRIRQMTDEELADFLDGFLCYQVGECRAEDIDCQECCLKWLKQEVSEDAGTD